MELYGEAPPKKDTFFRLEVHKSVETSRVEVKERLVEEVFLKQGKKQTYLNYG